MSSAVLAAFVINAALQIPLIALVAWLAVRMLRSAPARQQHLVWVVALLLCLALPLMSAMPRTSRIMPASSAPQAANASAPRFSLEKVLAARPAPRGVDLAELLAVAYGAFTAYRALALLVAWRRTRRIARAAGIDVRAAVRMRCGIDAPIVASSAVTTPMTVGAIQPVIILPAALFEELSDDALLSLVGHEAAHIRRRDFLVNLALELVAVPIAFHPVVWLLRRRLALTRELACDEQVTPALVPPRAYARALVDVASFACGAAGPMVSLTMAGSDFEQRIRRIVRRPSMKTSRILVAAAWVALVAAGGAAASIAVRPTIAVKAAAPPVQIAGDAEARAAAACAAGRARNAAAIPQLLAMLGDDTPVHELQCYAGNWSPALQSFDHPSPGEQAALALASISRPAVNSLIRTLDDRSPVARRNAAWAIGEARGGFFVDRRDALAPLIRLLGDGDATVRRAAAFGLSELKDSDAVEPLIAILADRDEAVRGMVIVALAEIRDARAAPYLTRIAASDSSPEIRRAAAWALTEIN